MSAIDIFELLYEPFKLDPSRPVRLFEAFSGIGTQHMALKRLGLEVDLVGISEVDKFAIASYEAIHGKVKNYGGIGTFDRLPANIDIATWSFPCQDISQAGTQRGMTEGTQSNYGYVFLDTVENTPKDERPQVLLMENVRALLSKNFREDWREIQLRLERMGYKNYADSLIATDYGVPQTRDRVFIVSILGDYSYKFPKPFELKKKLKDYLGDEVNGEYYLDYDFNERFKSNIYIETTNYYHIEELGGIDNSRRVYKIDTIAPTLTTIKENAKILVDGKVRILTEKECWRLMGISDEDFEKASKVVSNSQLYKQAGNAIVVDVLYHIFREMLIYEAT